LRFSDDATQLSNNKNVTLSMKRMRFVLKSRELVMRSLRETFLNGFSGCEEERILGGQSRKFYK